VGRNRLYNRYLTNAYRRGPRWPDPYHCEWGAVVGDRIRRLRRDRDMTLHDLAHAVNKPEGGHYSAGYFSRLERGWASAPLYAYLAIADALDVDPGVLLGPDAATLEASEAETMLLRCMRGLGIEPHEAMLALTAAASGAEQPPAPAVEEPGLASDLASGLRPFLAAMRHDPPDDDPPDDDPPDDDPRHEEAS
jgi:transcriptional regulator with XRE-family HTH domain